jgi:hypothetical protein
MLKLTIIRVADPLLGNTPVVFALELFGTTHWSLTFLAILGVFIGPITKFCLQKIHTKMKAIQNSMHHSIFGFDFSSEIFFQKLLDTRQHQLVE